MKAAPRCVLIIEGVCDCRRGKRSPAPRPPSTHPALFTWAELASWRSADLGCVRVCWLEGRVPHSLQLQEKKKSVWDSAPLRPDGGAAVVACFKLSSCLFWQLLPAEPNPPDTSLQVLFFFLFYRQRSRGRTRQPETDWFGQTQVSMNSNDQIPKMQKLSFDVLRTVLS